MELMILSFKTKINDKPTHFPHKIWCGLLDFNLVKGKEFKEFYKDYNVADLAQKPKIHTIREDKKDRWKPGVMIDFFINARQKNMFRFAPRIPVISRQRIFMTYMPYLGNGFEVSINGRQIYDKEIEILAQNDGFESVEDFEEYFISQMADDQFSGIIIHWTNFKY